MNILFVHQDFPGQFRHLVRVLAQEGGHHIVALGIQPLGEELPKNVTYIRYGISRANTPNIHDWVFETETKVIRGEACAEKAHQLKQQGFRPNIICAHPGWGESLFLKDIWPDTPLLSYQEFYYHASGYDNDFDSEIQQQASWKDACNIRMKNSFIQQSLHASDWNITPTQFQRDSFPAHWKSAFSTIHDGIDSINATPNPQVGSLTLIDGTCLKPGDPTVTYVNRAMEPYRGCHTMLRAIPQIQKEYPDARVVIVGDTKGRSSYGPKPIEGSWCERFLKEIEGSYDPSRVHFTETISHRNYLHLLQLSAAHVYLTYPFVLSWSLLEAMSSGCAVVGSNTPPVEEVVKHNHNGLIVDFFNANDVANSVILLLKQPTLAKQFGNNARQTILQHYSVQSCTSRQLGLLRLVSSKSVIS